MRSLANRLRRQDGVTLMELLIVCVISVLVSGMIVMVWIALSRSYSYSATSTEARNNARLAMAHMVQEMRDAQSLNNYAPIQTAGTDSVTFATTFNQSGNTDQSMAPRLVRYSYDSSTSTINRTVDANNNGNLSDDTPQVLLKNVINARQPSTANPTPVFTYNYYNSSGVLTACTDMTGVAPTSSLVSIQVRLLVDLNPGHSPTYMDLQSNVVSRNTRHT